MTLTQERVKELFEYDDGRLIRKVAVSPRVKVGDVAGSLQDDGYLRTMVDGRLHHNHRLVWLWHKGYMPEGEIDHRKRIRDKNNIEDLREVSHQCNMRNSRIAKNNTSGVKGVSWHKGVNKWISRIKVMSKSISLGYSSDFTEAVSLRFAAEQSLNWDGCDSSSTAFLYMQNYILEAVRG